jgi:anti-sigma regulatory factor (Ser/Thr protein kinase)
MWNSWDREFMAFAHPVLFYRGASDYLTGTVPFIRTALAAGEPVAVAVPTPRLRLLCDELGADAHGVWMVDMSVVGRNPGHIIPGVLRAFADKHDGPVRMIDEPVWPTRTAAEYAACAQHEAMLNYAFADLDATVLCPYDAENLTQDVLDDAQRTHNTPKYAPDAVVEKYNEPLEVPGEARTHTTHTGFPPIRRFVADFATHAGLERVADMVLAVDELTANSVRHGGGAGTVYLWSEPGSVVCQVEDHGHLLNRLAGRVPAAVTQFGGRGLLLVNHLADLVRIHTTSAGTAIRVYFTLANTAAPPAANANG